MLHIPINEKQLPGECAVVVDYDIAVGIVLQPVLLQVAGILVNLFDLPRQPLDTYRSSLLAAGAPLHGELYASHYLALRVVALVPSPGWLPVYFEAAYTRPVDLGA